MRKFEDSKGRAWEVEINVTAIKRVKDLLGVDLMDALDGKLIERLAGDPVLLVDAVYCLCKDQADRESVSDEDFGRAMAGDAIERASEAFLEELVASFPQPRRGLLAKALGKLKTLEATAIRMGEANLDSGDLERQLQEAMSGALSGNLPGSSASTPDR